MSSLSSLGNVSSALSGVASGPVYTRSPMMRERGWPSSSSSQPYEPLDCDPTESVLYTRTWIYHAVMDAVARVQEEYAVPIAVYI